MTAATAGGPQVRQQAVGAGFVLLATVAWSFSGLFTRALSTDVLTAIAWRAFFGGVFLVIPFVAHWRKRSLAALAVGWPGLVMVACLALCSACTVGAFYFTSIANAAVIYATAPFLAAGLSYVLLGERLKARTAVACVVSLLGVVIIVTNAVGSGRILGDLLALGMTLTFAVMIVIPRIVPGMDMAAITILGSATTTLCFVPFGHAAAMPLRDWAVLAGFGFTNFTFALLLFLAGARRLAGAQAALIGTLDVVLAPLWVWIVFEERPAIATFLGGGLILAVVVWHTGLEWREARRSESGS